jgi:UDP-glucose 6-dehydrogenase
MRFTECRSLELITYASNAFLATKIAFIKEMTDLARRPAPMSRTSPAAWAAFPVVE